MVMAIVSVCVCVRACVRGYVRVCVRVCVRTCVCACMRAHVCLCITSTHSSPGLEYRLSVMAVVRVAHPGLHPLDCAKSLCLVSQRVAAHRRLRCSSLDLGVRMRL